LLDSAIGFTQKNSSFEHFDRAAFLVRFARPLWNRLYHLQAQKGIPFLNEKGLANTSSPQLFGRDFFNAASFNGITESTSGR
jgi:cytochrome c peroxidase